MHAFMLVQSALLLTFLSCKPVGNSALTAITGFDDDGEKALAIIPVINAPEITETLNLNNANVKKAFDKINEPHFALIECRRGGAGGGKASAPDAWMNLLEFYAFNRGLYIDAKRNVFFNIGNDQGVKATYPPCVVAGSNMLTPVELTAASAQSLSWPDQEPAKTSPLYEKVRREFLLGQALYLAIRGPYSTSGVSISPAIVGLEDAAHNYPSMEFFSTEFGKNIVEADIPYNPCVTAPSGPGEIRTYMQAWKKENFSCAPASHNQSLFNYRAGGNGSSYKQIRQFLLTEIKSLYTKTKGEISAGAPASQQLELILSSLKPWSKQTGPVAAALAGNGSINALFAGQSGFGLTGNRDGGLQLNGSTGLTSPNLAAILAMVEAQGNTPFTSAFANDPYKKYYTDWANTTKARTIYRESPASLARILGDRNILAIQKTTGTQLNQTGTALVAKLTSGMTFKPVAGKTELEQRLEAIKKNPELDKQFQAVMLPLIKQRETALTQQLASVVKTNTLVKTWEEFGVQQGANADNSMMVSKSGGRVREFHRLQDKTADGATQWLDWTASVDANGQPTGASRTVWQNKGVGGQKITVGDMDFTSSFLGNKRKDGTRSNIGKFYFSEADAATADATLGKYIAGIQNTVNVNNQNFAQTNELAKLQGQLGQSQAVNADLFNKLLVSNQETRDGALATLQASGLPASQISDYQGLMQAQDQVQQNNIDQMHTTSASNYLGQMKNGWSGWWSGAQNYSQGAQGIQTMNRLQEAHNNTAGADTLFGQNSAHRTTLNEIQNTGYSQMGSGWDNFSSGASGAWGEVKKTEMYDTGTSVASAMFPKTSAVVSAGTSAISNWWNGDSGSSSSSGGGGQSQAASNSTPSQPQPTTQPSADQVSSTSDGDGAVFGLQD